MVDGFVFFLQVFRLFSSYWMEKGKKMGGKIFVFLLCYYSYGIFYKKRQGFVFQYKVLCSKARFCVPRQGFGYQTKVLDTTARFWVPDSVKKHRKKRPP